eukprot:scaffold1741_cov262-Pinguiococcus_pyrenoidosus.AAC.49
MIVNDGHAFIFNRSATAKFGVFPRDASDPSEIVWVDTEEIFFSIHTLNAYDVDEERVLVTAERVSDFSMDFEIGKDVENEPNYLWQWQINHKKRKVEWNRQVTSVDGGFPVINEDLHCHPNQFGYVVKTQGDFFNGILKVRCCPVFGASGGVSTHRNPTQSNPIQPNPIQSNPTQRRSIRSKAKKLGASAFRMSSSMESLYLQLRRGPNERTTATWSGS